MQIVRYGVGVEKDRVTSFYSHMSGWNMFDAKLLTPALEQFLAEEALTLGTVCQEKPPGTLLIEAGCGYGRYMQWALSRGFSYLGCDLVPWLIDMGQIRLSAFRKQYNNQTANLYNLSIERLTDILPEGDVRSPNLVFFPFNCFGNLSNVITVMETLTERADDVFISTFRTDPETSQLRKAYYANCGYRQLSDIETPLGTVISSQEGLHAIAYSADYLEKLFTGYGFSPVSTIEYGTIGVGYHFRQSRPQSSNVHYLFRERHGDTTQTNNSLPLPVTVSILQEEGELSQNGQLLDFENYDAAIVNIAPHEILLECSEQWPFDTIVKLEFLISGDTPHADEHHVLVATTRHHYKTQDGMFRLLLEPYGEQPSLWPLLINPSSLIRRIAP